MEQSGLYHFVGLVLALLFAAVMGLSFGAVLIADYMQPGRVVSEQARHTLILCGIAGALAGIVSWWMQRFAARRGLIVRFIYGTFIFTLLFLGFGGLMEVGRNYMVNPGPHDWSLSGLYWASLGGFYTFALFLVVPVRLPMFGLLISAGVILALVGPKREY